MNTILKGHVNVYSQYKCIVMFRTEVFSRLETTVFVSAQKPYSAITNHRISNGKTLETHW